MTTRGRPDYRQLDHTADLGLLVRAPSAELLFERMAAALFDVMLEDIDEVDPGGRSIEVTVEAPDREALLVTWLNELIGIAIREEVVLSEFEVRDVGIDRLSARVGGEPLDPARHRYETEIKAATYHYLLVSEDDDGWSGRVILDV
jgi:SHS2 domain-containing protein